MIPVLGSREMRSADRAAIRSGVPGITLMENAAAALAADLLAAWPEARRVAVVCGPGNNGGDGLAAARLLAAEGVSVFLFTLGPPERYRGDAAENAERALACGLKLSALGERGARRSLAEALAASDVVLDALFGTGLSRGLDGEAARAVAAINASRRPVIAADLPSGLSADEGRLLGPAVRADRTVAFAAAKPCHVLPPARDLCGRVAVRAIGVAPEILERRRARLHIAEASDVAAALAPRRADSHKGNYGRLAIVAGSRGKTGAAALAARGALRAGAGLVTVFCPASIEQTVVGALPEAMTRGLPDRDGRLAPEATDALREALEDFDAAAVGPGLGVSAAVRSVLQALLRSPLPLVCDADALNALAPEAFARRGETVLTPHPGEAARLLSSTTRAIQADRLGAAIELARRSKSVVVLKGSGSLIARPRATIVVNPTGTPLMSTAGSGDVLTGALAALLAGGLEASIAAMAAVYLHGAAGDFLERTLGDAGLLASELADALPRARRNLAGELPPGSA
ncbi:MAG TPA: NAD(P)H-hydrate dehydratase [Thermoanaerobaculia bacterium]|nr:NAD(P)H-hydrate dehydratase [Thermoanaerobaculia bacterium]